ncbi:hypothetical protein LIT38_21825 [Bacillus sp. CMF12]|nr:MULTISPECIES: hypothetical protein [Bacillaceae]MDF2038851.1 hypothetical protein [Cytobacillus oceanisediminis]UOE54629.1 hypothetical protein IRB79_22895 [Cytobacillus oceanisediminis]USK49136.1 hypothetical protein LIT38_21825 [Bacillus sp. CMF12]
MPVHLYTEKRKWLVQPLQLDNSAERQQYFSMVPMPTQEVNIPLHFL